MQEVNLMGKGDRKSRKGKIWRGTNGKTRPKKKKKAKQ
jgi:30S ribosomal protein S31